MSRNIALIGAAGFVGTNLALGMEQRGHTVTLVDVGDRFGRLAASGLLDRAPHHFVDLARPGASLPECDVLVNLAALPQVDFSLHHPELAFTNNVAVMSVVLEAARRRGTPLLFTSSIEVYGGNDGPLFTEESPLLPLSPYAASKIACEGFLESYRHNFGIAATTVRLTNLYGPWQAPDRIVPRIAAQALLGVESEAVTGRLRDFLAVADAVDAICRLVESDEWNNTFNIAAGNPTTLEEAAETVVRTGGCGSVTEIETPSADGRGHSLVASSARLGEATGWKPTTALSDGIAATTAWYRDNRTWWQPFREQVRSGRRGPEFLVDHAFPFWSR
ncbi:NAD-dependent epimerase/dehydratase family protein [Streptomyces sulphureus]|uniref:NAD-dependent epimerase/dehydratase family protein n=1 Tax=Streptomyces sulphureus TaxID=47758 RepID=UPI00036FDD8C|nr:NAD(P)-dependent oxidoreductase [Streptomyces sulphureus]